MHKTIVFVVALLFLTPSGWTQTGLESVLTSVRTNNKTIVAAKQYAAAQKLTHRTGNAPDDPFLSADYLIGRPRSGGNQVDFVATQSFDFPSSYSRKKELADERDRHADLKFKQVEQAVIWEAKQIGLTLIHLNKQATVLEARMGRAQNVLQDFEQKFKVEEIGLLEVSKARIRVLGLRQDLMETEAIIKIQGQKLTALNGGKVLVLTDTLYPEPGEMSDKEAVLARVLENDPALQLDQQDISIEQQVLQVNKALALPKMEAGYHYQSVLGQTFNGVHFGTSIPLWKNRNKVEAVQSYILYQEAEAAGHRLEVEQETESLYLEYESLGERLEEFRQALQGLTAKEILKKALDLGELDFITYSMELDFYNKYYDQLLEIEHRYHLTIAEMLKSTL